MTSAYLPKRFAALCVALLILAVSLVPSQAQSCLSAAQTRSAIAAGEIVSLSTISAVARSNGYSQVGSASVCGSPGRYAYVVVASRSDGASARLTFNASNGALLSAR